MPSRFEVTQFENPASNCIWSGKCDHDRNQSLVGNFLEVCLVLKEDLEIWCLILLRLKYYGGTDHLSISADECNVLLLILSSLTSADGPLIKEAFIL